MKVTKSLKERLFVMFLRRDLDLARMVGDAPNMGHSVRVARQDAILAVEAINAAGGVA